MACRGGLLARARPGDRARLHGLGSGPAASAARRRFLVASLGGPLSAPSPNAVAVAQEVNLLLQFGIFGVVVHWLCRRMQATSVQVNHTVINYEHR